MTLTAYNSHFTAMCLTTHSVTKCAPQKPINNKSALITTNLYSRLIKLCVQCELNSS